MKKKNQTSHFIYTYKYMKIDNMECIKFDIATELFESLNHLLI